MPPHDERVSLYAGDPPGLIAGAERLAAMEVNHRGRYHNVHKPVLDVFHAQGENPTGAAVVICPGGGYGVLAYDHEGIQVAQWLSENGITAIILRYRMKPYIHPIPQMDVQRALQTVRSRAEAWSIDPTRIGVMGFSAGGHLASTAAVHHLDADPDADDPVLRVSSRPDFAVLVYPVISMRPPHGHAGSRRNLLGPEPDEELVERMSTHTQVNEQTPPTLLVHSLDDRSVKIENSRMFLASLEDNDVAGTMLTYEQGGHGYGLGRADTDSTAWPEACLKWLDELAVLEPSDGE